MNINQDIVVHSIVPYTNCTIKDRVSLRVPMQ